MDTVSMLKLALFFTGGAGVILAVMFYIAFTKALRLARCLRNR